MTLPEINHLRAISDRRLVHVAPGATTPTLATLDPATGAKCLSVDMFRRFLAGLLLTDDAGAVQAFEIIAATAADGTGATKVAEHPLSASPDATGDFVWLETLTEHVRYVLPGATHVGVRVQLADAGAECALYFERAEPFYEGAEPTEDYIGA